MDITERLQKVLAHLQIDSYHLAADSAGYWQGLVISDPYAVKSITTVVYGPPLTNEKIEFLKSKGEKANIILSAQSPVADTIQNLLTPVDKANRIVLESYLRWDELTVEYEQEICDALIGSKSGIAPTTSIAGRAEESGVVAEIAYQTKGHGPALLLFPLAIAPSQWKPIIDRLSEEFFTVVLGGPHLGFISMLEGRGKTKAYRRMVQQLLTEAELEDGQTVLDVGCGTGVFDRWIVQNMLPNGHITAVDVNKYFLDSAEMLSEMEGLEQQLSFRQADAQNLPFEDNTFDIAMSITVLEEVDADKVFAEMIRVTKVGGKVAVLVRATDTNMLSVWFPINENIKAKIEGMQGQASENGYSTVSLFAHFNKALDNVVKMPLIAPVSDDDDVATNTFIHSLATILDDEQRDEWFDAAYKARDDHSFLITTSFHAAVGTKISK